MQNLARARYVTRYYDSLKGLRIVPFGLLMLVLAARQQGWVWLGKEGDCSYTLPLLIVMIAVYFAAGRYYARSFGVVQTHPAYSGILPALGLLSLFFGVVVLEVVIKPPFSLLGLAIGLLLAYAGVRMQRIHYTISGASIAVLSLVPLFLPGPLSAKAFGTFGFWWNFLIGLTWVIMGLLDHLQLVRSLKSVRSAIQPAQGGNNVRAE